LLNYICNVNKVTCVNNVLFTFVIQILFKMKERLIEFLKVENKTSAQFAEEIGVQPSGISHILSGRNNPSLDFVMKMLEKFNYLSTDWLLFGKGSMYKENRANSLFDLTDRLTTESIGSDAKTDSVRQDIDAAGMRKDIQDREIPVTYDARALNVAKIVWFYADNSFEEYIPRQVTGTILKNETK